MDVAGSPGIRERMTKTIMVIPIRTGTAAAARKRI
jgi:hypothetical protein